MCMFNFSFCNSSQKFGFKKEALNDIMRKNNCVQAVYQLKVGHVPHCLK